MLQGRERQGSAYRSVRYSTIRKETLTANEDRLSLNRLKRKPQLQSTFYDTRTLQMRPRASMVQNNPQRPTYLESFHSMFQSQKKVKDVPDEDFKLCNIRVKFSSFDQDFASAGDTEFTLLDPFQRPYSYLKQQLSKNQKELSNQSEELKLIKAQLAIIKHNTLTNLKKTEQDGMAHINRIRNALKHSETFEQERKMRVRREITQLFEQHDFNLKLGEEILTKTKEMQSDIFSCRPFQLEVEQYNVS